MHLVLLDRWNSLQSPVHRLDPRSKTVALLGLVVFLAASSAGLGVKIPAVALCLVALVAVSRVPLAYCLERASLVLPFSLLAVAAALVAHRFPAVAGDGGGLTLPAAAAILGKSYVSALAVLLLVATTRLSELLKALEFFRVPAVLLMIVQFLYRYLFVLSEEAQHMSYARHSRSGGRRRTGGLRGAGAALAVLFARSYARAERIHRAMLARGFSGTLPSRRPLRCAARDFAFVAIIAAYLLAVQMAAVLAPSYWG